MKLVIATNNASKLKEIREILDGSGLELISQEDAGFHDDVSETGHTYEENARLKAAAVMQATGLPALADDSGMEVAALGSCPGIFSARFLSELGYSERCYRIMKLIENCPDRSAKYVCTTVCLFPDGREIITHGELAGSIADHLRGANGFGYDQMFYVPEQSRTFAELTDSEKNAISHRGIALREFLTRLKHIDDPSSLTPPAERPVAEYLRSIVDKENAKYIETTADTIGEICLGYLYASAKNRISRITLTEHELPDLFCVDPRGQDVRGKLLKTLTEKLTAQGFKVTYQARNGTQSITISF